MSKLEEVYKSSSSLMAQIGANHQEKLDFLQGMRFLLKGVPDNGPMLAMEVNAVIEHLGNLQRVATSYHQAVGQAISQRRETGNG